ncbi:unnamed protein product [Timema podura]|uniref:Uncharacterized protein n=1 Tax=Timema podura TaxID=61482 RepID=A0ABN7PG37_TIMPD|nr:unnamed protein product [Timema podura]
MYLLNRQRRWLPRPRARAKPTRSVNKLSNWATNWPTIWASPCGDLSPSLSGSVWCSCVSACAVSDDAARSDAPRMERRGRGASTSSLFSCWVRPTRRREKTWHAIVTCLFDC